MFKINVVEINFYLEDKIKSDLKYELFYIVWFYIKIYKYIFSFTVNLVCSTTDQL